MRVFIILALLLGRFPGGKVNAADQLSDRNATIVVSYIQYEWWLLRWSNNQPLCQFHIEHEGWPTGEEIYASCGSGTYTEWKNTPTCAQAENGGATDACPGLYLYLLGNEPAEKTIIVDLPPALVFVTLLGCTSTSLENLCPKIPSLLLTGEEPLPNEYIAGIHALYNGQPYTCQGGTCEIPLQPTPLEGVVVEFWADSSYGDSSQHFTAQVRVIDSGPSDSPVGSGWYVDVLSAQWRGPQVASCAEVWQAFPPVGGPPAWLSTPEVPELLASDESFYFLAGRLISSQTVDASDCPEGGLLANGYANACGLDKALQLVQDWQNRFDEKIIQAAQETNVPAQLMKNLFAQESQFWPGVFRDPKEFGLGQITDNGAETVLLWNPTFYNQFCPLVLDADQCEKGYIYLKGEEQATLRGALALQAKVDCPDCPMGIDLTNTDFSIKLFAETIRANCEQVAQIVYNGTQQIAGKVSSYEDLWRFTVANYHAGAGCVSYAVYSAYERSEPIDWAHVSQYFTPACQGVISYVEKIAR